MPLSRSRATAEARLSFAKSASDSRGDSPSLLRQANTPGDWWAVGPTQGSRQLQALGPATPNGGGQRAMDWRQKEGSCGAWGVGGGRAGRGRLNYTATPDVSMMQATDFGNRHDLAQRWQLDGPPVERIASLDSGELVTCVFPAGLPRDFNAEGVFAHFECKAAGTSGYVRLIDASLRQRSGVRRGRGHASARRRSPSRVSERS